MRDELRIPREHIELLYGAIDWASYAMDHSPEHEQQWCMLAVDQAWLLLRHYLDVGEYTDSFGIIATKLRRELSKRVPAPGGDSIS